MELWKWEVPNTKQEFQPTERYLHKDQTIFNRSRNYNIICPLSHDLEKKVLLVDRPCNFPDSTKFDAKKTNSVMPFLNFGHALYLLSYGRTGQFGLAIIF